jgi:hypothetical protein
MPSPGSTDDNKDLFIAVFAELSCYTLEEYQESFVDRLPAILLEAAAERNPTLETSPLLAKIRRCLDENPAASRNPELYPHLMYCCSANESFQPHLEALAVQLGLRSPWATHSAIHRFVRVRAPEAKVLEHVGCGIREVGGVVSADSEPGMPLVYSPHPGLFTDVAGGLYHATDNRLEPVALSERVRNALRLISNYSSTLHREIAEHVNVIAFTSDPLEVTRSFSMRVAYLGGIFSAICDPVTLAENVIHEYYHGRLWSWWLVERPADLPGDEVQVTSPVTGEQRPLAVMLHALLIYISLMSFYQHVVRDTLITPSDVAAASARLSLLERATRTLVEHLQSAVRGLPYCQHYVCFLADLSTKDLDSGI